MSSANVSRGNRHAIRGNRMLRDIPERERLLEIDCYGERRERGRLVAVVTRDRKVIAMRQPSLIDSPRAGGNPVQWTLCRCDDGRHPIDVPKALDAADRLQHQPVKARRVDVTRLAPDL
jgi:hypothetical protein